VPTLTDLGLDAIFRPRSVAVIGASRSRGTIGAEIFHNLVTHGFTGAVYPVNPRASSVQAVRAYADVASIPEPIDLAIIVVPAAAAVEAVDACAAAGVRGVVVISAGFKETGTEGAAREAELVAIARSANMRLVGPNCLGVLNTDPAFSLDGTFAPTWPPRGRVGFLTQSGALGVAILDYARGRNLGISTFAAIGNRADVSANDMLERWEHDPDTDLCLLYLEGFGNPHKFTRIARRVSRKKPIVVVKSGRSEVGRRAAASHTGSLAGLDVGVDALLHQTGVIRVDSIDELFNTAMLLANQPLPHGKRVAILSNAGGPGILAADACQAQGLEVVSLSEPLRVRLRALLPAEASVSNPVDMVAHASPEAYENVVRMVLGSDEVDAALVIFVPPIVTAPDEVARAILRGADGIDKPVVANFLGRHGVAEGEATLAIGGVPAYPFPELAAASLARAARYAAWRALPDAEPPTLSADTDATLARLSRTPAGGWLGAADCLGVLRDYGIRATPTALATTAEQAVAAAERIGFPVAVKLASRTLLHKTEARGVRLGLRRAEEVYDAFAGICARATELGGGDAFDGVLVQSMVDGGVEMVVGAVADAEFGHLVMVGLGGVTVELLRDVAFRVVPVTEADAREMIDGLRGAPLLRGYRGAAEADQDALVELVLRVSQLVREVPDIGEIDLNPVLVRPRGHGALAVDVRIRRGLAPPAGRATE
jgi:acetyl coenzyme A synthetase (ADP forming)-like protein